MSAGNALSLREIPGRRAASADVAAVFVIAAVLGFMVFPLAQPKRPVRAVSGTRSAAPPAFRAGPAAGRRSSPGTRSRTP